MNDTELDALIASATPITEATVASLPVNRAATHLRDTILDLAASDQGASDTALSVRRRRPGFGRWAAAAAVAALTTSMIVSSGGGGGGSVYAAEVVEIAEAAPRLLVTADDWRVARADEFSKELGELTFANGERQLDLHWRPGSQHDGYVGDRAHSSDAPTDITVDGHAGVLFRYSGTNDFTALWSEGDHSVELRGVATSEDEFRSLAASVERVSVDEWLSAMPESVVKPGDRAAVIAEMLRGIPLPPAFDVTLLDEVDASVSDRYQLGARVAGAVACAWIDQWVAADARNDAAAKAEAANAIGSTKEWPVLVEMVDQGDYPEVLWEYADDITERDGVSLYDGRDRIRNGEYEDGACIR